MNWAKPGLVVAGSVVAGLGVAVAIALLEKATGLGIGSALTFVVTAALVGVTWVYVDATRRHVVDQQKGEYFRAVARAWKVTRGATNIVGEIEVELSLLVESGQLVGMARRSLKSAGTRADRLVKHADELLVHVVHFRGELESETWRLANDLTAASTEVSQILRAFDPSLSRTAAPTDSFDPAPAFEEWVKLNPERSRKQLEKEWAEMKKSDALKAMHEQIYALEDLYKAELLNRSS